MFGHTHCISAARRIFKEKPKLDRVAKVRQIRKRPCVELLPVSAKTIFFSEYAKYGKSNPATPFTLKAANIEYDRLTEDLLRRYKDIAFINLQRKRHLQDIVKGLRSSAFCLYKSRHMKSIYQDIVPVFSDRRNAFLAAFKQVRADYLALSYRKKKVLLDEAKSIRENARSFIQQQDQSRTPLYHKSSGAASTKKDYQWKKGKETAISNKRK